jgi:hypothetical protein
MANIYNEPGSTAVKITLKNNVYSYLNTNIGIAKICLITDQKKFGYSDLLGNLKKCLTDASGSSLTPENCVFIADSEGSASHSTTFVYNDNKLGVNIAAPKNKAHFHEPTTGSCLIQITNSTTGSSDEYDGMTIGIVGDDNVIRTTYMRPVKIQSEVPGTPGTFRDIVTFKDEGARRDVILDADLYINNLPAKSDPATTVLVPDSDGCVSTRTVAQIRSDIGAASAVHGHAWSEITDKPSTFAPASHTLVSHSDWSTYFNQALKTTSTPTFASINISNGGLINDWAYLGKTESSSSPYKKCWYKAYELTGTGSADEDIELRIMGDVNYYYGSCIVRLKIRRYGGEPANQLHVTITPISGWPSNALVKVDGGIVWVASNLLWGDIYGRLVQSRFNPGRVLFNTTPTETEPAGVSINGTFGVKTYDGDTQNVVFHNVDGANGNFTGQVNANNINNTGFLQNTGYTASIYPSNNSVYYRDVYQYRTATASFTGTMKFTLPKSWSGTMLTFTIKGYDHEYDRGAWECIISGYNYRGEDPELGDLSGWFNCSAEIRGFAPFSQVKLAHDGTKCCLLLGDTSTHWVYPQVAITEVFASYNETSGWGEPYSMSFITSETGLTEIHPPRTIIYGDNDIGTVWFDYDTPVDGVVFDLIKKVKYKRIGKRIDILYSFKKSSTALSVGDSFSFNLGQTSSGFDDTFYTGICINSNGEQVGVAYTIPTEGFKHLLYVTITKATNEVYGSFAFYTA